MQGMHIKTLTVDWVCFRVYSVAFCFALYAFTSTIIQTIGQPQHLSHIVFYRAAFHLRTPPHCLETRPAPQTIMGKAKKTRKIAAVKRVLNPKTLQQPYVVGKHQPIIDGWLLHSHTLPTPTDKPKSRRKKRRISSQSMCTLWGWLGRVPCVNTVFQSPTLPRTHTHTGKRCHLHSIFDTTHSLGHPIKCWWIPTLSTFPSATRLV